MRHRIAAVFAAAALLVLPLACRNEPQPDPTATKGNATDRLPSDGTQGTAMPTSVATDSAIAATAIGHAPPSTTPRGGLVGTSTAPKTETLAMTGTEVVSKTATTSTIQAPGTTTMSATSPTATSATFVTDTAVIKATVKKKP